MEVFSGVADWISGHETLLSGIAALIVVGGVVLTVLSTGWERVLVGRKRESGERAPEATAAPARAAPSGGEKPSLAVLPFTNLSDSSEQDFLADGMTEDLITGLSANRHLSVVARNSSFAYKGRAVDVRAVGRELAVRYVLEGSVRRVGERLRTTAQLIETETGAHLWAEKYDRPYDQIFAVQDELIASIAGSLNAQLTAAEYARARSRIMLALYLDALGRGDEARAMIARTARENPGLNLEGLALLVGAHPDPEQGRARAARLREYWPRAA